MIKAQKTIQPGTENILEEIEEGYYEIDLEGRLTFYNAGLCKILGYTSNDLKYRVDGLEGVALNSLSDEKHRDRIANIYYRVLRTGRPTNIANWKIIRQDGRKIMIEASVSLIADNAKNPVGFRGFIKNITQRVKAEREREKSQAESFQAQKMEAIGTIVGGIAHDLNNILSGIVSYPDLLLMKVPPASPLRKPIEGIKKCGEKASSFVQDLLTVSRKGISNPQILNLNNVITEFLDSPEHRNQLIYHPLIEVETAFDADMPKISASRTHIIKIIKNLIFNATESMPNGGTIHLSTKHCPGNLQNREDFYDPDQDYIRLQVMDNGTGFSSEAKERIFEPFYAKNVLGQGGSGLEMAVVWAAVQDLNGFIDVKSKPGKGTKFNILLPAAEAESAADHPPTETFDGTGEKILVVDDWESQREIVAHMLETIGYKVHAVASGEAAVLYLKNNPVDLLILDMKMEPGIDGLETYKRIIQINPAQKAVICSGFSTSDRVREAQRLGAGQCLMKPILMEDLSQAVRTELDK